MADSRRRRYLRRPDRPVTAVRLPVDSDGLVYRKWGGEQRAKPGDWLVDNDGDVYSVDADVFARTYRNVAKGAYVKTTPVWAKRAATAGSVRTKEGSTQYQAGDYLVSNSSDGSDAYAMTSEKFEDLYKLMRIAKRRRRALRMFAPFILALASTAFAQPSASPTPAVPLDARTAIIDAFGSHSLVALGETHGHREREIFLLDLIADSRFAAIVSDIVVEGGISTHQPLVDRFVGGADVLADPLRRVWRDTPSNVVEMIQRVREINATRPKARRLRVLLGEPPVDRDRADPGSDRNRFAARLIEREVLGRKRRALLTYGSGHFVRRTASYSLVTLLERNAGVKVFNIWTNVIALGPIQDDVESWPVPSLTLVRDTPLGISNFARYFPPTVLDIPPDLKVPMQDQFDAVLYVGPTPTWTFQSR